MFGAGAGLAEQLDDAFQRGADLPGHVALILARLIAAGLARKHDPFAGAVDHNAVGKAARFRPFGRLQNKHESLSKMNPATPEQSVFNTDQVNAHV